MQSLAQAVAICYAEAQAWLAAHPQAAQAERETLYLELTSRTHALGLMYAKVIGSRAARWPSSCCVTRTSCSSSC